MDTKKLKNLVVDFEKAAIELCRALDRHYELSMKDAIRLSLNLLYSTGNLQLLDLRNFTSYLKRENDAEEGA